MATMFARLSLAARRSLPSLHYLLYNTTLHALHARQTGSIFADITDGNNCSPEFTSNFFPIYQYAFNASRGECYNALPGWDAATGLGVPRYQSWLQLLKSLAPRTTSPSPSPSPTKKKNPHRCDQKMAKVTVWN
eukprot:TRINITY_DN7194_c0_g1_i1.p2 TRINITY_DN7194_c0_g1~~TRINITY_DN7194_c0_g1_i1.p2  ORF type:complete len:134 (-),score=15.89 TRINITY_DN7194_c0_g1_i1:346-747(-)